MILSNKFALLGPLTPQNTGLLTIQTLSEKSVSLTHFSDVLMDFSSIKFLLYFQSDFRISSTGAVLELDKSKSIVKKLKLVGTPLKIYKKTAFIQVSTQALVYRAREV